MKPITEDEARQVRSLIAEMFFATPDEMFMADHNHECLTPGAWSIAFEGGPYCWPQVFSDAIYAKEVALPAGIWMEAINSCTVGLYREG